MKKIYLILLVSVLAVGCNDPRSLVIPQDTSDIDAFSENVKTLNAEEKYLLNSYLTNYGHSVPVGKTVQEAIDETREFLKKQDAYSPPE